MTTPPTGTVALIGAGEYLPTILLVDKMVLERLTETPRVVVLPTAAATDGPGVPERGAPMGVEHFSQLDGTAEPIMLLNRINANDPKISHQLASANFIPRYLLETLKGRASWQATQLLLE